MHRKLTPILGALLLFAAPRAHADEAAADRVIEEVVIEEDEPAEPPKPAEEEKPLTPRQKLDQIVLPENPSREQCEAYIAKLREHVGDRRSFSSNDPEVDKLKAIPPAHQDLIFDELFSHTRLQIYASYSVRDIDPEAIRETVIQQLPEKPKYMQIVARYGWFDRCKDVIRQELATAIGDVDAVWFQAFVEVAKPEDYPRLHEIATASESPAEFIPLLESLPDYDMVKTIDACWESVKKDDNNNHYFRGSPKTRMACYAADVGHVDALAVLIEDLRQPPDTHFYYSMDGINERRLSVTRRITFRGSDKEIMKWFDANKDKLVFDQFTKRFVVMEEE